MSRWRAPKILTAKECEDMRQVEIQHPAIPDLLETIAAMRPLVETTLFHDKVMTKSSRNSLAGAVATYCLLLDGVEVD